MRVLVLGAYGLIGEEVVGQLTEAGHEVVGLGRNTARARRRRPECTWITADLADLRQAASWAPVLMQARVEAVVNCAGALQDGSRDDVAGVQSGAIRALLEAATAAGIGRLVQISAPRAEPASETPFMRTKGEADAAVQASALEWTILRPGLVLAPQAYGGSALLRALAAVPLVQPLAFADSPLQTVWVCDVARAVVLTIEGKVASRRVYDLVEDEARPLGDVLRSLRSWLGYAPAPAVPVPVALIRLAARIGDALGWLGWRPPLRAAALRELAAGVVGDPAPWRTAGGPALAPLDVTLRRLPSTVQERWFARAFLLKPLAIGTLAGFWAITGLLTLLAPDDAAHVLRVRGVGAFSAYAIAIIGAIADLALGLALLWRRTMPSAALGMIFLTLAYLAGASVLAPDLWTDPLGPLVKTLPALVLALVVLGWAEDR